MKTYAIPAPLLMAIADYLARQPYREVASFLAAVAKLKEEQDAPEGRALMNGAEAAVQ